MASPSVVWRIVRVRARAPSRASSPARRRSRGRGCVFSCSSWASSPYWRASRCQAGMTPGTSSNSEASRPSPAWPTGWPSTSSEANWLRRDVRLAVTADVFDARELFRVLAEHAVEFIVVGGIAVQTHGVLRSTIDLDIVPRPDMANLSRLGEALAAVGARMWKTAAPVNVTDPHVLRRASLVALMTDHGRLDLLNVRSTPGLTADYDALREPSGRGRA